MYNKKEKLRIDGLKTEHVRIILLAVPTRYMGQWYACREGDMQWRSLEEITEFYEDVRVIKGSADTGQSTTSAPIKKASPLTPKKEERRPLFEDLPDNEMDEEVILTSTVKERRSVVRYARQLEFKVRSSRETFTCQTHDISMNGLSLNEPLPRWVPEKFRAAIAHNGQGVRLVCQKVSDTKLRILDSESWEVIRNWIMKW